MRMTPPNEHFVGLGGSDPQLLAHRQQHTLREYLLFLRFLLY